MKNQLAKFTSGDPNVKLIVSLHKGKGQLVVAVRTKDSSGEKTVVRTGCRSWFSLDDEKVAVTKYEALIADAKKEGWLLAVKSDGSKSSFDKIPTAPKAVTKTGR